MSSDALIILLCTRYFARLAEERMGPEDQVVLVTHQPRWLMDWFWAKAAAPNLRQLVRGHLRGRARVHLAGLLQSSTGHSNTIGLKATSGHVEHKLQSPSLQACSHKMHESV